MSMQPGWYPDPFSSGGYVRWWDGERWGQSTAVQTPESAPVVGAAPGAMPPPPPAPGPYGSYGAPASGGAPGAPVATFALASWGQRAVARILDSLIESVLMLPFVLWLVWPAFQTFLDSIPADAAAPSAAALEAFQRSLVEQSLMLTLISAAVTFLYEVPQNVRWGRTLGKRALGIRIRPLSADIGLDWRRATVRWGTYTLGAAIFSIFFTVTDYLWPLWDKPWRQALHDKTAKTVVVPLRP
jgi:uncharacterized RDD family membrane protein YckC